MQIDYFFESSITLLPFFRNLVWREFAILWSRLSDPVYVNA